MNKVARRSLASGLDGSEAARVMTSESYWVGFTLGPFVYAMDLHGPPGSVSEEQAQEIASAYYERLTGN